MALSHAAGMTRLQHGPWTGVRNVSDPYEEAPSLLYDAINYYIPDPDHGSGISLRPPVNVLQAGGVLGTVGGRYGQCIYDHTRLDGTIDRFQFVGGQMYRWDGNTTTPGFANITPATVAIAPGTRIFCTSLADRLIVHDGVNLPWIYDPATSTATVIPYQAATVLLSVGAPNTTLAVATFAYPTGTGTAVKPTTTTLALTGTSVAANLWGSWRVSISTTGVFTVTAATANQTFATEPLAIAALPAVPAGSFDVGYVTLQSTGSPFSVGITALVAGSTALHFIAPAVRSWTAYGQPVRYGAKVFFILGTVDGVSMRTTIAWSEEAQPLVGYFQAGFDNTWTLSQTSADPLFALAATESALYYMRQRGIGQIYGAVSSTFRTTATLDAVSTTLGTTTNASVLVAENYVWFLNEDGLPHRFAIGSRQVEPLWLNLRDATQTALATPTVRTSHATVAVSCYQPELRLVCMAIWAPSATISDTATTIYVFSATSGSFQGRWMIGAAAGIDTMGVCRDASGRTMLTALGPTDTSSPSQETATRGAFSVQRRTGDMGATIPWTDVPGTTLAASITTGELLGDATTDKLFDLVALRLRSSSTSLVTPLRVMAITYATPRVVSGGPLYGAISQGLGEDRKLVVGTGATGRWAKITATGPAGYALATEAGTTLTTEAGTSMLAADVPLIGPFTIEALTVDVYSMGDDPTQY